MMNNISILEELFGKYKDMTEDMIVKFNNNINIDGMLTDRKKLLEKISEVSVSGNKKEVYLSLGIDKIDSELGKIINESAKSIKEEIRMNKLRRQTTNSYNSSNFQNYYCFSKRV